MKKKVFSLAGIAFLAFLIREVFGAANYVVSVVLSRGDKMFLARCADLNKEESTLEQEVKEEGVEIVKWLEEVRRVGCKIQSADGLPLFGEIFLREKYTDKWVVVVHGYGGVGRQMYYAVKRFYDKGYNVVLPDLRCHGSSGGDYIGMGWKDRLDIIEWCRKIINGNPKCKIVLYGVSMGGATVLMAGGEVLPKNVVKIISDCSYKSAMDILAYQLKEVFKIPPHPFVDIIDLVCKKRAGYRLREASAIKQVKKCRLPILFFHGDCDKLVPTDMVYRLYEACESKKHIFIVKGAGHGVSAMVGKRAYWDRVFKFLDEE